MAVPDYQSLMLPVLKCIADGKEWNRAQCADKITKDFQLSDQDVSALLPSGSETVLFNRIGWAVGYMKKAGLLESPRWGYFKIAPRGSEILRNPPLRIDSKYLLQFPEFSEWLKKPSLKSDGQQKSATPVESTEQNPEEKIQVSSYALREQLKDDLLEYLRSERVSPSLFERVIVDLLVAMNYGGGRAEMAEALGKTGDGGIDGVVREDALGLDAVYIQAKKYAENNGIGRPQIQSFVGSLEGMKATKGVFVTTSYFSGGASEYVERVQKRVVLIDGERLAELMIQHNVGVRIKETFELKKLDEDYFV